MIRFLAQNWGNLASVAGLVISICVLVVAKRAKQAAEGALRAARLKSFAESLEEARAGIQQLGASLRNRDSGEVLRLAQELSDRCWQASARWGDHLSGSARNDLTDAAEIIGSLASVMAERSMQQLDQKGWNQALESHMKASMLISIVLGEAHKVEERTAR